MSEIGRKVDKPAPTKSSESEKGVSRRKDEQNWPNLWAFLHNERDFGEKHKTGSITLFVDGDKIKMVLNDRPCRKSVFVSGQSFGDCFNKADMGLESLSLNWSGARYQRRSRAKVYG